MLGSFPLLPPLQPLPLLPSAGLQAAKAAGTARGHAAEPRAGPGSDLLAAGGQSRSRQNPQARPDPASRCQSGACCWLPSPEGAAALPEERAPSPRTAPAPTANRCSGESGRTEALTSSAQLLALPCRTSLPVANTKARSLGKPGLPPHRSEPEGQRHAAVQGARGAIPWQLGGGTEANSWLPAVASPCFRQDGCRNEPVCVVSPVVPLHWATLQLLIKQEAAGPCGPGWRIPHPSPAAQGPWEEPLRSGGFGDRGGSGTSTAGSQGTDQHPGEEAWQGK